MYKKPSTQKFIFIYIITNLINNKQYVGFHATNNLDDGYMGSGKYCNRAIKKYGLHNFKKEILEYCTKDNWIEKEIFWIKEKNTFYPNGYNLTKGGEGAFGALLSEETKRKISIAHIGKPTWNKGLKNIYSKETIEKIKKSKQNFVFTDEHKRKISIANKGKIKSAETKEKLSNAKKGDLNPSKKPEVKEKISKTIKGMFKSEKNPMFKSNRNRNKLKQLSDNGIKLKGDHYEYMRKKIQCENILTGEIIIYDGIKDIMYNLNISRNKYYNIEKNNLLFENKFKFKKLN